MTLTGTASRSGAGHGTVADSIALASQRADSAGPYSVNGENSPQPAGPWMTAPSRTVMPRNRVRIGMANARSVPSSSGSSFSVPPPTASPRTRPARTVTLLPHGAAKARLRGRSHAL